MGVLARRAARAVTILPAPHFNRKQKSGEKCGLGQRSSNAKKSNARLRARIIVAVSISSLPIRQAHLPVRPSLARLRQQARRNSGTWRDSVIQFPAQGIIVASRQCNYVATRRGSSLPPPTPLRATAHPGHLGPRARNRSACPLYRGRSGSKHRTSRGNCRVVCCEASARWP